MQPTRLAASSAVMLLLAISIWLVARSYYAETCKFDKRVHADAVCVDSVAELLANPDLYDGKMVIVSGELGFPLEGHYLRDQISDTSISLSADVDTVRKYKGECRFGGQVKGTFSIGKSGHFGHWPGELSLAVFITLDETNVEKC